MRVWITGGEGMLAQALVNVANDRGVDVVVTGRAVDVADRAAVFAFVDNAAPDVVINAAAYTAVDAAESDVDAAVRVNVDGAGVVGAAAARVGARALHVSTDYVFDGASRERWRPDDPTAPVGVYGTTKRDGELAFLAATASLGCVVRTSWLFGPNGPRSKNFVTTMLRLMGERPLLKVVNDQHGRPTSTATLASTLFALAGHAGPLPAVLHCADTGETTWFDFACAIERGARARGAQLKVERIEPIPTSAYPTPAKRPAWSILDTNDTEALLGHALPTWEDTLAAYLDTLLPRDSR
jgi:dTDP-4-dehydrorhamnose reductase